MWTTLVDVQDLRRRITDPRLVVLDCRHQLADPEWGPLQYRLGHIPGAHHAHMDRDLSSPPTAATGRHPLPDPLAFRQACGRWGIDATTQVVAYDDGPGVWAARLWWLLQDYGHKAVALLDGGYKAWLAAGLPPETSVVDATPRTFKGTPGHRGRIEAQAIQAGLRRREAVLLDARAPERFRGELEPVDPVAGHIPGARSLPALSLSGTDGRMAPVDQLRRRFDQATGGAPASQVAAYCGSGVTASYLVLAAEVAGLGPIRLYPGSWSEWIRDAGRPVETGDPSAKPKAT